MCSSVSSHHTSVNHMINLANQNELNFQTCQAAAYHDELRHNSTYKEVISRWD